MRAYALVVLLVACGGPHGESAPSDARAAVREVAAPPPTEPRDTDATGVATRDGGMEAECTRDQDCRTHDDYCEGCRCRALPAEAPAPACTGREVACFAAPCRAHRAVCQGGKCAVVNDGAGATM